MEFEVVRTLLLLTARETPQRLRVFGLLYLNLLDHGEDGGVGGWLHVELNDVYILSASTRLC